LSIWRHQETRLRNFRSSFLLFATLEGTGSKKPHAVRQDRKPIQQKIRGSGRIPRPAGEFFARPSRHLRHVNAVALRRYGQNLNAGEFEKQMIEVTVTIDFG